MKIVLKTLRDDEALNKIDYTQESIQDDNYDYSGVIVIKPWGYEYLLFENKNSAVWILHVNPESSTSMHCHPKKKTSLIVLQGSVVCSTLDEDYACGVGMGLIIEKGVFHQTKVISKEPAIVMEIETPVNKRDLVRLRDQYGREGKAYENEEFYTFNNKNFNLIKFDERRSKYDNKKYFDRCSLNFIKVSEFAQAPQFEAASENGLLILLSEPLLSLDGSIIIDTGEVINARSLDEIRNYSIEKKREILQLKIEDNEIKCSDYIASFLKEKKVGPIFLVPGEANVHLVDSVGKCDGLTFYSMDSEKGASFAGEGFSKSQGEISTVLVSSGSSALGVIQGVANSWVDSTPMLILSGQGHSGEKKEGLVRQQSNKSIDIVPMVKTITKFSARIDDPKKINGYLEKAIFEATNNRPGPVWLDLPIDVQGALIKRNELEVNIFTKANENCEHKEEIANKIKIVIKLLNESKRPVLLVGDGARSDDNKSLIKLVSRIKIPVLTSRRGADLIPEANQYYFGRPGSYGQRSANFILQNSDLIICLGSRFTASLTGRNANLFAREAKIVLVEIDKNEINSLPFEIELSLHADCKKVIKVFLNNLLNDKNFTHSEWLKQCTIWSNNFPRGSYGGLSLSPVLEDQDKIYPLDLMKLLSSILENNEILIVDGGAPLIYVSQAFEFKEGQRLISSNGLELPGFAISASIGVGLANRKKTIVCVCEDHGLLNSIQELRSYVEKEITIKILVLKSKGQSIIRNIQSQYFGGRIIATNRLDHSGTFSVAEVSRLFGFKVFEANDKYQLEEKLKKWIHEKAPSLFAIDVADDHSILPRPGFVVQDDLTWVSKPLEDMYPFLKRDVYAKQMLIN